MGKSTRFIEYMLGVIEAALTELLNFKYRVFTQIDRLNYFIELQQTVFTRKDYMHTFKDISSSTASRDLKKGIELNFFKKTGEKNKTRYEVI